MRTNKLIIYIALFTGLISACKEVAREGLMDAPDKAKIAVIHTASPTRPTATTLTMFPVGHFYSIDGKLMFSQPLVSNRTTGYQLVEPGSRVLTFDTVSAVNNTNNALPRANVKTVTINAAANTYHSVYLSGKAQQPEVLVTTDDLSRPAQGKAKIRFVHLSPDGTAVDFAGAKSTIATRPILIGNRTYNTSSDFISIDEGFYTFELRNAGTSTVITTQSRSGDIVPQLGVVSTVNVQNFNQLIEPGKIYTFISRGYVNPSRTVVGQPVFPLSVTGVVNSYF
jgi:hypothetical protein